MKTDAIRFNCRACGHNLSAPARAAGKRGKCSTCGSVNTIPTPHPRITQPSVKPQLAPTPPKRPKTLAIVAAVASFSIVAVVLIGVLGGNKEAPPPTGEWGQLHEYLTDDEVEAAKAMSDFAERQLTTAHAKRMWLLAIALAGDGYRLDGDQPMTTLDDLNFATCGFRHIEKPTTAPFEIEWRLDRGATQETARSFLKVQNSAAPFDGKLEDALVFEWLERTAAHMPAGTNEKVAWLLAIAAEIHRGDVIDGDSSRFTDDKRIKNRGWLWNTEDSRQYHLEMTERVGDYTFTFDIQDCRFDRNDGPWSRAILWFTYGG